MPNENVLCAHCTHTDHDAFTLRAQIIITPPKEKRKIAFAFFTVCKFSGLCRHVCVPLSVSAPRLLHLLHFLEKKKLCISVLISTFYQFTCDLDVWRRVCVRCVHLALSGCRFRCSGASQNACRTRHHKELIKCIIQIRVPIVLSSLPPRAPCRCRQCIAMCMCVRAALTASIHLARICMRCRSSFSIILFLLCRVIVCLSSIVIHV